MSERHAASGPQEEDRVPSALILGIGATAVVIFTAASLWALAILKSERAALAPADAKAGAPDVGRGIIGLVDQPLFEKDPRLALSRGAALRRLSGYGFIDPKAGTVYIPIDRAMELVVRERR